MDAGFTAEVRAPQRLGYFISAAADLELEPTSTALYGVIAQVFRKCCTI